MNKKYWPNGEQLVISISMQFEAGGEPEGAESPFSGSPLPKGVPDLPAKSWFAYGHKEGIGRMLNLWDKYNIKVTSHIVGESALKNPTVAKAIADRGHEIAGHGIRWSSQYDMSYEKEKQFIQEGVEALQKITGNRAVGYNCNWLRRSKNTMKILADLGFLYHIDDVSRDEPFISMVSGKKFAVVPYTLRNNDMVLIEGKNYSAEQFFQQIKYEFDQLYAEGKHRRRMMSISLHDRIGGTPAYVQAVDRFIQYAKTHANISFKRKDEIAAVVLAEENPLIDHSEQEYNQ